MSFLIAVLVSVVYFHFARFYQGTAASFLLAIGWVPVVLNLLRAGLGLAYRLERHPFQELELGLESDQVAPGRAFEVEIRLAARRAAVLRRLAVELRCTRQTITEGRRQSAVLHEHEQVIERDLTMERGLRKTYRASLQVGNGAPYTFRTMEGRIRWSLHVQGEVDGWGDLSDEIEVTVAPG